MAGPQQEMLGLTLSGLEGGLRVRHIATFDLCGCAPQDEAAAVLAKAKFAGFDQVVVRESRRLVGVLERQADRATGPVGTCMRPLDSDILISAEAPLADFIRLAVGDRYRLVLTDKGIEGIVTRSDLLKLAVRLCIFMFVTHLEQVMARLIDLRHADGGWENYLSEDRQAKLSAKLVEQRRKRLDPPPLEFTDFADKRTILKKTLRLGKRFEKDLMAIEELRNSVAHAGNYADGEAGLQEFIRQMGLTERWIAELEGRIAEARAVET